MLGYSGSQRGLLAGEASSKRGKQLPGEAGHPGRIARKFASNEVVEDATLLVLVDLRKREVHAITRNRIGHAADEDYCTVRFDLFDHTDVGKGIVQFAVAVEVPRVVEKHEITGLDGRLSVEPPVSTHMLIDQPHPIRAGISRTALVEVDAVSKEDGSRHPGTVIANSLPVDGDCLGTDEVGRSARNRPSARYGGDGTTAWPHFWFGRSRMFDRRRRTAHQCGSGDGHHDEQQSQVVTVLVQTGLEPFHEGGRYLPSS